MATIIWDLSTPILSDTMDIVRSRGSLVEAPDPLKPKRGVRGRVYITREWHQRTRAEAGIIVELTFRGWRGPQPEWHHERCGLS